MYILGREILVLIPNFHDSCVILHYSIRNGPQYSVISKLVPFFISPEWENGIYLEMVNCLISTNTECVNVCNAGDFESKTNVLSTTDLEIHISYLPISYHLHVWANLADCVMNRTPKISPRNISYHS